MYPRMDFGKRNYRQIKLKMLLVLRKWKLVFDLEQLRGHKQNGTSKHNGRDWHLHPDVHRCKMLLTEKYLTRKQLK